MAPVQTHPSPQNVPLTDGQRAAQERDAQLDAARDKDVEKQRKEQMEAGKVTGDERKHGERLQELSGTDPAAAREHVGRRVDNMSRRSGSDPLQGHFVKVVSGEHAGRYGVYEHNATAGDDGYPVTVVVRTRDDDSARLVVKYEDLEPSEAGHR